MPNVGGNKYLYTKKGKEAAAKAKAKAKGKGKGKPKAKVKPKAKPKARGSVGDALLGSVGAKRKPKYPNA